MKKLDDKEIHEQLMKEIKATFVLIAIVAVWHVGFAFLLDGIDVMVFGMPLWFFVSTIGAFVISVVGVVILLKKVFVNFELSEEMSDELVQIKAKTKNEIGVNLAGDMPERMRDLKGGDNS